MDIAIRWAAVVIAGFLALIGWPDTAIAQSKEELIARYQPQCKAQNMHLKAQGYEAVREAVYRCVSAKVQAHMRAAVLSQLQPLWNRVDKEIDAGNFKEAEATAKRAIARATELTRPDSPAVASGYAFLGKVQLFQGRFRETEQSARKALPIFERELGVSNPKSAKVYNLLAYAVMSQGRQSEAEGYYNRALAIQEKDPGPNHPDTADTLISVANLRLEQGRLAEAERIARRAVAIKEKAHGLQSTGRARALSMLGTILRHDSRFAEAEATHKLALSVWDTIFHGKHVGTAVSLRGLAEVYLETGRYAEAEPLFDRSIETLEKSLGPDHRHTLLAMRQFAVVKARTGNLHQAELILRRAIRAAEKSLGPSHVDLVYMYTVLGEVLQKQERYRDAETAVKNGLAVAERIGKESPFVCVVLSSLGSLYVVEDRLAEAKAALERAFPVCNQALGPTHVRTISTLRKLAELGLLTNEAGRALEQLKQVAAALEARRETGSLLGGTRFNNDVAPLLRMVAANFAAAAWQLELADSQGKGKFADDALFGAQLLTQSTAATAIAQMGARVAANDDALGRLVRQGQDLQQRWEAIDRQLTTGFEDGSSDANVRRELRAEVDRVDKELSAIGRRIAAEFPEYAAFARPTSLRIEEIQKLIGADEVLLTFLVEGTESYAWAVSKTETRWAKLELAPKAIAKKGAALRCGLDHAAWEDDAGVCATLFKGTYRPGFARLGKPLPFDLVRAHELYLALFGEVQDLIKGKHLLIVPSGPLTQLPFQVLVTKPPVSGDHREAGWLAREHAVTILPAVSSLKALRRVGRPSAAPRPMIGVGNPLLDGPDGFASRAKQAQAKQHCPEHSRQKLAAQRTDHRAVPAQVEMRGGLADVSHIKGQVPLPETADELCAVARDMKAETSRDILLGAKATEREVKRLSAAGELAKYRVVHFATHGFLGNVLTGTREPGLILTPPATATEEDDGYLSASEIAALKLDADLVILSACNTAAGSATSAEALSGLARAFIYAQARALLVSHWEVYSDATVKLITGAVSEMAREPQVGRAEALRRSMLALLDKGEPHEAHPTYWAPFVLVGEGGRGR